EADGYNTRIQRFSTLNCAAISWATSTTYPQTRNDMGKTIRVRVTAANGVAPDTEALSFPTTPVLAIPENSSSPTISGSPAAGGTLTANPGTWSAYPDAALSYQWQRCEQDGTGCTDIGGATSQTYTATGSDAGKKLRVSVEGTNSVGEASANSSQVGPVTGPPVNTAPPTVTGNLVLGSTLTADPGTWSGYPVPTLSFQWQRCEVGGTNCSDIAGASGQTYVLTTADEGKEIRIVVTAVNSVDSVRSDSVTTEEVKPVPPTPTGKPRLVVKFQSPKRIRAGRPFGVGVTIENRADPASRTNRRTRATDPTTATSVRTCIRLPRGMVPVKQGGARLRGVRLCWTDSALRAGRTITHRIRVRTILSASGPATLRVSVTAENAGGTTFTAKRTDRVEVVPVEPPKPRPPTG
ncbi:MAG: hypothetical protein ACO3CR_03500, partial [Solirubrobacterales bacterium]